MAFATIVQQMAVLGFCMLAGFVARKAKIIDEPTELGLTSIILNITLPCMIVGAIITQDALPDAAAIGTIFFNSWVCYAIILVFALVVPRLMLVAPEQRGSYSYMLTFGNVGFIGFPVCNAIFGPDSILYAAIMNIPFNILAFTVGIMMLRQKPAPWREQLKSCLPHLKSPTLIACIAALVLALLGVCDTGFVGEAVSTLGELTTPGALLIIGSNLAKVPAGSLLIQVRPYIMSLVRLIAIPVVIWLVFRNFIADPTTLGVLVITSGMPVATNATLLCLRYGGNLDTITRGTFISTVLSLVTIPLLAMLVS